MPQESLRNAFHRPDVLPEADGWAKLYVMRGQGPSPQSVSPPDLPVTIDFPSLTDVSLQAQGRYEDVQITGLDVSTSQAADLKISSVLMTKLAARGVRWRNLRLKDARLTASDFANADWVGANILRVELIDSRFTGASLSESKLADVRFVGCKIDQAWFQQSTFDRCRFERCDLVEADFGLADLRGVVFSNCDLRRSRLARAKLDGTDFRGSKLETAQFLPTDLCGAIMEPMQLPDLAPALGIVLRAREER